MRISFALLLAVPAFSAESALTPELSAAIEKAKSGSGELAAVQRATREIVRKVAPSVVSISFEYTKRTTAVNKGRLIKSESVHSGTGSGVIVDGGKGWIITNEHVVSPGRNGWQDGGAAADYEVVDPRIEVRLAGGKKLKGEALAWNESRDLCLLRVDPAEAGELRAIEPAPAGSLEEGDLVVAFGSPWVYAETKTFGHVSKLKRETLGNIWIQHDAAINPGNSGGPLVDSEGRLVGINTRGAIPSGGPNGNFGINLAIPAEDVRAALERYRREGRIHETLSGIAVRKGRNGGLEVTGFHPGGHAEKAGLLLGDVIAEVDGVRIDGIAEAAAHSTEALDLAEEYGRMVRAKKPGDTIRFKIFRGTFERPVPVFIDVRLF